MERAENISPATPSADSFTRNLFELENARNMTVSQLTSTFYPTKAFWRILSAKNHIILGARGSGKTALTRMLWHNHLAACQHEKARAAIASKAFIGIYTTTRVDWVGGLKNKPWMNEEEQERLFCWRLNLACCVSLLVTAESCLKTYVPDIVNRATMEHDLCRDLGTSWIEDSGQLSFKRLLLALEDVEAQKFSNLAKYRVTGDASLLKDPIAAHFEIELFAPLRRGIQLISRCLALNESTAWILCLDEAEYLGPLHQRLINTYMRGAMGNLYFKVTTLPYLHHTMETNLSVPLNVGDDFEYVYIDQDPVILAGAQGQEGVRFAESLFGTRAIQSGGKYKGAKLRTLLGASPLLEAKASDWTKGGSSWVLLNRFANEATIKRAERLADFPSKFGNEIARKILPALLLRAAQDDISGRGELDLYRGEAFAVRCGDANPRRLIRLFNSLFADKSPRRYSSDGVVPIEGREQTRIFKKFAHQVLTGVQTEQKAGQMLYRLLVTAGNEMARRFYTEKISTDQYYSIEVNEDITDEDWDIVKYGVAYGFLFPNVNANSPDSVPIKKGIFRLAYCLAPAFNIIPRRGRSLPLKEILRSNGIKFLPTPGAVVIAPPQAELPLTSS